MVLENDIFLDEMHLKLRNEAKDFVKWVDPKLLRDMDAEKIDYPHEFYHEAGRRNLLGLRFPKKYGGRELDWVAECVALEEIGILGVGLGCSYGMPIVVGEAINTFGTEKHKKKYLAPMLKGDMVSAEGLTEPRGGSDFFGTNTVAERDGDIYYLTGEKRFIAGAKTADLFLLYARTNPDPKVPGHKALSAFLVEKNMGVEIAETYGLLGFRGMGTARIQLKGAEVPAENLLLGENRGREIFNRMMLPERLMPAAASLGMRAALELAMKYASMRKAFGAPIRMFQGVSFKIADCLTKLDAARALVFTAAIQADRDPDSYETRRLASEAKMYVTQTAWEVTSDAMQILGGIGYTQVYPLEKALRDARFALIGTGSSEIMQLIIQHEAYRKLMRGKLEKERDIELDAIEAHKIAEKVYE